MWHGLSILGQIGVGAAPLQSKMGALPLERIVRIASPLIKLVALTDVAIDVKRNDMVDWMKKLLDEREAKDAADRAAEEKAKKKDEEFQAGVDAYFTGLIGALREAVQSWNDNPRNGDGDLTISTWGDGYLIRRPKMPGGEVAVRLSKVSYAVSCDYTFETSVFPNQPKQEKRQNFGIRKAGTEWQFNGRTDSDYRYAVEAILKPLISWVIEHRR